MADGGRVFVRYGDLLDDWVKTSMHVAETLQLQHVLHADSEQIRDGHRFVDPGAAPDEPDPGRPRPAAAAARADRRRPGRSSTSSPTPAATPPRRTQALDQLREAYVDLYEESAAISRSSVVAAEQRLKRQQGPAGPAPSCRARAAPTGSRTACAPPVPPSVRRGLRKMAGRERPMTAHAGATGLTNLEGHTEFDITWPWTRPGGLRPGATAVLRVKDEAPLAAVRAAAAAAGLRPRAGRRQRLDRRHPRGRRRDRRAGRAAPTS